jgi:4-diphosphocytidyl-2-C-methyl-D-erythritol kinase
MMTPASPHPDPSPQPAEGERRSLAPAKINLYLHVVGRRDDGYHLLDSLVVFADIADEVSARPAPSLTLDVEGPFAGSLAGDAGENLVLRAARLLAGRIGVEPRASLRLVKRLPVASGIGGGSSDAAAALRVLAELWGATLGDADLAELASGLGADVPVCVAARPAWLGGIGERLEPAPPLPETGILLVNPLRPLATPAVFKARTGPFSAPARAATLPGDAGGLAAFLATRGNDLAAAAIGLMPEIALVLDRLAALPGALLARMSGSGATCFALFASAEAAAAAARRLAAEQPGWWVAPGRLLA